MAISAADLCGVFTPIATPFDAGESLALCELRRNLARWNETPLTGYVILGSNGEFCMLDEGEKLTVLRTARREIPQNKLMIAGTGEQSTRQTIARTKQAADIGADAALVVNPSYYKRMMTPSVLTDHYLAIADASPIPIMLYNMPLATGIDMSRDMDVGCSRHSNIIGMKDTSGNIPKMGEIINEADKSFAVLAGSMSFFLPALAIGAVGGILALGNIAPAECVKLYELAMAGRLDQARALHQRLLPVNQAVTARWGIGGLKAALEMQGWYGGPPRSPLVPLDGRERAELAAIIRGASL